jgi:hypothetical protein
MDDLNASWFEHLKHLHLVLTKLREVNIKFNPNKCVFVTKCISFLRHVVSKKGTMFYSYKIKAMVEFLIPTLITNVCAFLGLIGCYHNYIKRYVIIVIPLFELTKKDVGFKWIFICQDAFETLKRALVEALIMY